MGITSREFYRLRALETRLLELEATAKAALLAMASLTQEAHDIRQRVRSLCEQRTAASPPWAGPLDAVTSERPDQ